MLDRKKHHFLQLTVIFGAIVIIALASAWRYKTDVETSMGMMGQSMGKMMQSMYLKNLSLSELVRQQEQNESSSGMESHHENTGTALSNTHFITTATIVVLLPFIIAGSAFLLVVWLK